MYLKNVPACHRSGLGASLHILSLQAPRKGHIFNLRSRGTA